MALEFVAAITGAIGLFILLYDRYKRWRRSCLLKDPFEIHFLIPKATEHKVDYYPQDSEYHYPDELTLPSDSERDVMVWMKPKLDVVLSELQFGCIGENESKPEPLYYFNPFIRTGVGRERHPDIDEGHYVDFTNYYHIMQRGRAWPKNEILITGLKMKTKKKGTSRFWVGFVMPEKRGDKFHTMRVE